MDDFTWLEEDKDFTDDPLDWLDNEQSKKEIVKSNTEIAQSFMHVTQSKKQQLLTAIKKERLEKTFQTIPNQGESYHVVSNGYFDYWLLVPHLCRILDVKNIEFYGSTWTINYANCQSMFFLFDNGVLGSLAMLTGTYFKQREASVYNFLYTGLMERKQKFACFQNHAKIVLLHQGENYLVIEGSANFTSNPRLEQYVINNNESLYNFHKQWMDTML